MYVCVYHRKRLCRLCKIIVTSQALTTPIVLITHPRYIRGSRPRKKVSPCGIKCTLTLLHDGEGVWVPLDCQAGGEAQTTYRAAFRACTAHV